MNINGENMKRKLIIIGIFFLIGILYAQSFLNDNESLEQDQNIIVSTVASITPVDLAINPEEYIVGAGDVFLVQMVSAITTTYRLQVGLSDELTIPGYGQVNLKGKSLSAAVKMIENLCNNINKNVSVNVNLSNVKKLRIPVIGAVETPGMITLPASSRLNDYILNLKLHHLAKDYEIQIRSENDTNVVNIYKYYLEGDLNNNPYIKSGESVYVPFADVTTECVEVYGPVNSRSLAPYIKGETLLDFYHRKIRLSDVSDYSGVTITRKHEKNFYQTIPAEEMGNYELKAGDILEFAQLERIYVNGYVNNPGIYDYIPGHTIYDYIAMAGGASFKGNENKVIIIRDNKKIKNISKINVQRGDIILVKRSAEDIMIGQISLLQFIASIASITTAFIAAYNSIGA